MGRYCILTPGRLTERSAIARRVALLSKGTFASLGYLSRFGTPSRPDRLQGHRCVGFTGAGNGGAIPFSFTVDGKVVRPFLPPAATVTSPESNVALGRLGFGLVQLPRYRALDDLAADTLVEVLAGFRLRRCLSM